MNQPGVADRPRSSPYYLAGQAPADPLFHSPDLGQEVDHLDLVGGGDKLLLHLKPTPGSNLDVAHPARRFHEPAPSSFSGIQALAVIPGS